MALRFIDEAKPAEVLRMMGKLDVVRDDRAEMTTVGVRVVLGVPGRLADVFGPEHNLVIRTFGGRIGYQASVSEWLRRSDRLNRSRVGLPHPLLRLVPITKGAQRTRDALRLHQGLGHPSGAEPQENIDWRGDHRVAAPPSTGERIDGGLTVRPRALC